MLLYPDSVLYYFIVFLSFFVCLSLYYSHALEMASLKKTLFGQKQQQQKTTGYSLVFERL